MHQYWISDGHQMIFVHVYYRYYHKCNHKIIKPSPSVTQHLLHPVYILHSISIGLSNHQHHVGKRTTFHNIIQTKIAKAILASQQREIGILLAFATYITIVSH